MPNDMLRYVQFTSLYENVFMLPIHGYLSFFSQIYHSMLILLIFFQVYIKEM